VQKFGRSQQVERKSLLRLENQYQEYGVSLEKSEYEVLVTLDLGILVIMKILELLNFEKLIYRTILYIL
jgi:hypothetical protein